MYVCMYLYVFVCMYVYMFVCMYVCICTHTHINIYTQPTRLCLFITIHCHCGCCLSDLCTYHHMQIKDTVPPRPLQDTPGDRYDHSVTLDSFVSMYVLYMYVCVCVCIYKCIERFMLMLSYPYLGC